MCWWLCLIFVAEAVENLLEYISPNVSALNSVLSTYDEFPKDTFRTSVPILANS